MKPVRAAGLLATMLLVGCAVTVNDQALPGKNRVALWQSKLVIAHRGASGYLPEHTLAAKAMAYGQGAHFIEQDLVMSNDGHVVVLHDHYLDTVTNVRDVFPDRRRADGRYYVVDFTLAELRRLAVYERFKVSDGTRIAVFEQRFPLEKSSFRIATFAEEIELIQGLNQSTGRSVGIYPEIKSPAFHRREGKDISVAVLEVLKTYGYDERRDDVFLQCFDANELQRIRGELFPVMNMTVPLVQLIGTGPEFRAALTAEGMKSVASYADGIGPSMQLIVAPDSVAGNLKTTSLVQLAHDQGLVVHPYTFRRDLLPVYAEDYDALLEIFLNDIGVDGVFTDFPDLTVEYIESNL
ncbi:MAG: glycerophosphodiester phosphodiesterase [Gammaproteobacteria bacterium]|nr:glycerophosphodiester phosphodiesterase [Gammaproteobacteria bacterium]